MRSVTGLFVTFGTLAGGYVPSLWGGSDFSVVSLLTGAAGGIAGLWLALRLQDMQWMMHRSAWIAGMGAEGGVGTIGEQTSL